MIAAKSAAAKRLPPPKRGNVVDKNVLQAEFIMFQSIVDDLYADRKHILPTFCFLSKRKVRIVELSDTASYAAKFASIICFASMDEEFKI